MEHFGGALFRSRANAVDGLTPEAIAEEFAVLVRRKDAAGAFNALAVVKSSLGYCGAGKKRV